MYIFIHMMEEDNNSFQGSILKEFMEQTSWIIDKNMITSSTDYLNKLMRVNQSNLFLVQCSMEDKLFTELLTLSLFFENDIESSIMFSLLLLKLKKWKILYKSIRLFYFYSSGVW
jgi:hypothetical protein